MKSIKYLQMPIDDILKLIPLIKKKKYKELTKIQEDEVFRAQRQEDIVVIFRDGHVVYHATTDLDKIFHDYFHSFYTKDAVLHSVPLTLQMSSEKCTKLSEVLDKSKFTLLEPKAPEELKRYERNKRFLTIMKNGTILSPGGSKIFYNAITEALMQDRKLTYDIIISQTTISTNGKSPLMTTSVAFTEELILKLFLLGVKAPNEISVDQHLPFARIIIENAIAIASHWASNDSQPLEKSLGHGNLTTLEQTLAQLREKKKSFENCLVINDCLEGIDTEKYLNPSLPKSAILVPPQKVQRENVIASYASTLLCQYLYDMQLLLDGRSKTSE